MRTEHKYKIYEMQTHFSELLGANEELLALGKLVEGVHELGVHLFRCFEGHVGRHERQKVLQRPLAWASTDGKHVRSLHDGTIPV